MNNLFVLFLMAFRNVAKNWRHSLAAILTISASFMAQVLFSGYMSRVELMYNDSYTTRGMYGNAIIENKDLHSTEAKSNPFEFYLQESEQELVNQFLQNESHRISVITRFLQLQGMITNGKTSAIFWGVGYDPDKAAQVRGPVWKWNTIYGVPLQNSPNGHPILLAQALSRIMGCAPVTTIKVFNSTEGYPPVDRPFQCATSQVQLSLLTESGQINALDFDVSGIIDSGYQDMDNRYLQLSLSSAQTLLNTKKVTSYSVLLKKGFNDVDFINDFQKFAAAKTPRLRAVSWKNHPAGDLYRKTMELLSIFRIFVVTVILVISCLSVLNTMVKIVKERTREIGTLRSVGYVRSQIMILFSAEAFFLSTLGIGLGMVMSILTSLILNQARIPYRAGIASEPVLFQIMIVPQNYLTSVALLITLALFAAYLATRAAVYRTVASNLSYA